MDEYISKTTLKSRGWTETAITIFLHEADKECPNPHYKKAAPTKLYLAKKVEDMEKREEFQEYMRLIEKRKESSKKAVETKRQRVIDWVNGIDIVVPDYSEEELINLACNHYNRRVADRRERAYEWAIRHYDPYDLDIDYEPDFSLATPNSGKQFLARITTNYLRHQCTMYEDKLRELFGKVGKEKGHDLLKERINEAIHLKYPWTANYEPCTYFCP